MNVFEKDLSRQQGWVEEGEEGLYHPNQLHCDISERLQVAVQLVEKVVGQAPSLTNSKVAGHCGLVGH